MSTQFAPPAPEQEMVGVIRNVTQRTVNKKDGSGTIKLFDVQVEGFSEMLTTMNARTANECFDLKDQQARITYVVKQNGAFTNYFVNAAVPAVNGAAQFSPQAEQFATAVVGPDRIPSDTSQDDREASIHRQCATKVAAWLVGVGGAPHLFWENVDVLMRYYETGEKPPDSDIPF